MKPILFYLGSFPVRAYSVFLLLAMGIGFLVLRREWRESRLPPGAIYAFCAGAIVSGLLGGRLGYLLLHGADYLAEPGRLLRFWQAGGETAWGALGGLLAWTWLYGRRLGLGLAGLFDLLAPPAALAEGIMRWGCLLNGCCYGRPAAAWPGVYLPDLAGHWALRYPTQLLYSAVGLGLFVFLWAGRRHRPFAGFIALTYLVLYTAARLAIGFLRGDMVSLQAQLAFLGLDLALLAVGAGLLAWRMRQLQKSGEGAL